MKRLTFGIAAVLTVLASVQPAFAQISVGDAIDELTRAPKVQEIFNAGRGAASTSISGSFQGVTDIGGGRSNGWVFGARRMLTRWFGVEAELNGAYGASDHYLYATSWRDHSLLGGVRFSGTRRLAPFGRVQAGFIHSAMRSGPTSIGEQYQFPVQNDSWSRSGFVIQPGGGLEMMFNRHFGVSAAIDVQISQVYLQSRFTMGAVVPLGR